MTDAASDPSCSHTVDKTPQDAYLRECTTRMSADEKYMMMKLRLLWCDTVAVRKPVPMLRSNR